MIIALLSGYNVANMKILHTIAFESLVSEVLLSFLGSIDVSNHLYDYHNRHGFLHLIEGLEILPDQFLVSAMEENNCFFLQIAQVTSNFCGYGSNIYTIIAIGGKLFPLIKKNSSYIFLDSHSTIQYGAKTETIIKIFGR